VPEDKGIKESCWCCRCPTTVQNLGAYVRAQVFEKLI